MKTIKLPVCNIELTLTGDEGGSITSELEREVCPSCGQADCCFSCDGSQGADENNKETEAEVASRLKYNGALDGIEAMILAHASAGIDVASPAYLYGIETAIDAAGNNL